MSGADVLTPLSKSSPVEITQQNTPHQTGEGMSVNYTNTAATATTTNDVTWQSTNERNVKYRRSTAITFSEQKQRQQLNNSYETSVSTTDHKATQSRHAVRDNQPVYIALYIRKTSQQATRQFRILF